MNSEKDEMIFMTMKRMAPVTKFTMMAIMKMAT